MNCFFCYYFCNNSYNICRLLCTPDVKTSSILAKIFYAHIKSERSRCLSSPEQRDVFRVLNKNIYLPFFDGKQQKLVFLIFGTERV